MRRVLFSFFSSYIAEKSKSSIGNDFGSGDFLFFNLLSANLRP
jgi:hypothetical protein